MLRPPGAEAVCQHFMAASVALDFSDVYMTPHGTREFKHLVSTSALPSYSGWRMQGSWACSARSEVLLPSSSWARRLEGTFKDYLVENDVATLINLNHLRQSSEKLQALLFPPLSSSCCCCLCCLPAQKSLQTAEVQLTLCKQSTKVEPGPDPQVSVKAQILISPRRIRDWAERGEISVQATWGLWQHHHCFPGLVSPAELCITTQPGWCQCCPSKLQFGCWLNGRVVITTQTENQRKPVSSS